MSLAYVGWWVAGPNPATAHHVAAVLDGAVLTTCGTATRRDRLRPAIGADQRCPDCAWIVQPSEETAG